MTAGLVATLVREPGDPLLAVALGACAAASVVATSAGVPALDGREMWARARHLAGRLKDEVRVLT